MTDAPIFLVGATATGKSAMAMELARASGGAILAMDAMQVYRGADIGTSKPTAAEQAEVPHGGLDLVEFGSGFDVAQYLKHAEQFLREQREARRRVIIVGGTGLYFRALTQGLCEAPQGSEKLRAELNALSTEELRERLKKIDPGILESLDGSNPRRLIRAIEVMEATGKSLREWQAETPEPLVRDFMAFWIGREKAELARRIEERVESMFAAGWLEEVRGLIGRYGLETVKAFPGIGYREIAGVIGEPDQITELAKLPNLEEGKVSHGGLKRAEEEGSHEIAEQVEGKGFDGINGMTELGKGGGIRGIDGGATELRGQVRSQVQLGNEGMGEEGSVARRAAATKLKSNILVATRQYAKRQLTWFAREPKLQRVMLTGSQPFSEVVPSLL